MVFFQLSVGTKGKDCNLEAVSSDLCDCYDRCQQPSPTSRSHVPQTGSSTCKGIRHKTQLLLYKGTTIRQPPHFAWSDSLGTCWGLFSFSYQKSYPQQNQTDFLDLQPEVTVVVQDAKGILKFVFIISYFHFTNFEMCRYLMPLHVFFCSVPFCFRAVVLCVLMTSVFFCFMLRLLLQAFVLLSGNQSYKLLYYRGWNTLEDIMNNISSFLFIVHR